MTDKDAIRTVLMYRNMSQAELCRRAGVEPTRVSSCINRDTVGMQTNTLLRLLHAANCELIVRDKVTGRRFTIDQTGRRKKV